MRRLIIRNATGHTTMDLDTEEAIQELERLMNEGMLAVAVAPGGSASQVLESREESVRRAEEVRVMWPLRGGRG